MNIYDTQMNATALLSHIPSHIYKWWFLLWCLYHPRDRLKQIVFCFMLYIFPKRPKLEVKTWLLEYGDVQFCAPSIKSSAWESPCGTRRSGGQELGWQLQLGTRTSFPPCLRLKVEQAVLLPPAQLGVWSWGKQPNTPSFSFNYCVTEC